MSSADLDRHSIIKELYIQAQHWTRHNENLIVTANTFLITATGAFTVLAFRELPITGGQKSIVLGVPVFVAIFGIILTLLLSSRYVESVQRMIQYEKILNCHDEAQELRLDSSLKHWWGSGLIPRKLHAAPKIGPATSIMFLVLHSLMGLGFMFLWCRVS